MGQPFGQPFVQLFVQPEVTVADFEQGQNFDSKRVEEGALALWQALRKVKAPGRGFSIPYTPLTVLVVETLLKRHPELVVTIGLADMTVAFKQALGATVAPHTQDAMKRSMLLGDREDAVLPDPADLVETAPEDAGTQTWDPTTGTVGSTDKDSGETNT